MGFNDEMDFDLDEIRKLLKEKDEKPEGSADGEDGAAEAAAVERPRRQLSVQQRLRVLFWQSL